MEGLKLPVIHILDLEDIVHPGFRKAVNKPYNIKIVEEVEYNLSYRVQGKGYL